MRKYFLFIFLFFASFSFSQEIIGEWNFDYILPETIETGENLKPISENDFMQINEDGTFSYEIANADLIAEGRWELNENILSFNYRLPKEMTRVYQVSISENFLVLNESSINYAFTKSEIIPEVIITSGITINSISRGILGIFSLLLIAFLFSRNRKGIDWTLVYKGLGVQMLFAILIFKGEELKELSAVFFNNLFEFFGISIHVEGIPFDLFEKLINFIGLVFIRIISFTQDGTMFLFKSFETGTIESPLMNFVVMILPTVIFFSALTSLFYYWRILPLIVYGFAWMMKKTMGLSGPESVAAAGNIFLGQTESPLLVKPYLDKMTMSEMMCLMSGGMATIAGGVLAAYIGFLGGDDPEQQIIFAKHLLAASVMSAPAAVIAAKILLPEKEKFETKLEVAKSDMGSNALEAISKGTTDGLRLAVNVGAMLLVFIGLMSMANYILETIGSWSYGTILIRSFFIVLLFIAYSFFIKKKRKRLFSNFWFVLSVFIISYFALYMGCKNNVFGSSWICNKSPNDLIASITTYSELSFHMILSYIGAPIAWLMGVCKEDMFLVGQLLGEKTVLNEFVAYVSLGEMKNAGQFVEQKSIIIATYILCGFANFASIGIQIGGIGSLAPKRKGDLARLGFLALIGGTLASLFTAVIVGMLI